MQKYKEVKLSEWQQIDAGLQDIRRKMAEKYMVEFN